MLNRLQEKEEHNKKEKNNLKCTLSPRVGDRRVFLCFWPAQQISKCSYVKFQKKIFIHSQEMVEYKEKQRNRQKNQLTNKKTS